jgi:hypothetical protein
MSAGVAFLETTFESRSGHAAAAEVQAYATACERLRQEASYAAHLGSACICLNNTRLKKLAGDRKTAAAYVRFAVEKFIPWGLRLLDRSWAGNRARYEFEKTLRDALKRANLDDLRSSKCSGVSLDVVSMLRVFLEGILSLFATTLLKCWRDDL